LGCLRLVALNKRELIKTKSTKVPKQTEIKPINLLHEHEFILLNRIFFAWLNKNSSKRSGKRSGKLALNSSQQDVFIIATQLLSYGIRNGYKNLNVSTFLSQWSESYQLDKAIFSGSILNHAVFVAIKLLVYGVFSIFSTLKAEERLLNKDVLSKNTGIELSIHEKAQNFLEFLFKFKEFLLQNWHNLPNSSENVDNKSKTKKQKPKIYYTYRLTYQEPGCDIKQYYMGYRGCSTHPLLDEYYSSSDLVKELKRQHGSKCLNKKILGIYLTKQEALAREVLYHETLKVDTNKAFLNKAKQTTTAFFYDNTGSIQTDESNEKRSKALKGRNRFTTEGLASLIAYQAARERSDSDREALSQAALARNAQRVVCPYCGKEGQVAAMHRWHFENCKEAPIPSKKSIEEREKLRKRMLGFNTNKEKDTE
jgi:hypothetical protein